MEFAPPGFPDGFNNGLFVGMHGQFSLAGVSNEENPLAYVDLRATTYLARVDQAETGVGHLDGLLSTQTKLYVADISPDDGFNSSSSDEGIIYRQRRRHVAGTQVPDQRRHHDRRCGSGSRLGRCST